MKIRMKLANLCGTTAWEWQGFALMPLAGPISYQAVIEDIMQIVQVENSINEHLRQAQQLATNSGWQITPNVQRAPIKSIHLYPLASLRTLAQNLRHPSLVYLQRLLDMLTPSSVSQLEDLRSVYQMGSQTLAITTSSGCGLTSPPMVSAPYLSLGYPTDQPLQLTTSGSMFTTTPDGVLTTS